MPDSGAHTMDKLKRQPATTRPEKHSFLTASRFFRIKYASSVILDCASSY